MTVETIVHSELWAFRDRRKYEDDDYDSDDSDYESQQDMDCGRSRAGSCVDRTLKLRFETTNVSDCCEIVNRIEHLMRNSH